MNRRLLAPLFAGDVKGTALLVASNAVVLVLGLALQLLALRELDPPAYSSFVFALAIANIAYALASAVQPVVARGVLLGKETFLPAPAPYVAGVLAIAMGVAIGTLGAVVGWTVTFAAFIQIPLHLLIGVAYGRLQARRAFALLAVATCLFAFVRLAVSGLGAAISDAPLPLFAISLPTGLAATAVLLAALRAFRDTSWSATEINRELLTAYVGWVTIGWLMNADAVLARVVLDGADAGSYATAFTLGRLPVYLSTPLALVLLPGIAGGSEEARSRSLVALGVVIALLGIGTAFVLDIRPDAVWRLLTGVEATGSEQTLLRLHSVVGLGAAALILVATFSFAAQLKVAWAALAIAYAVAPIAALGGPSTMAVGHAAALWLVVCWMISAAVLRLRSRGESGE